MHNKIWTTFGRPYKQNHPVSKHIKTLLSNGGNGVLLAILMHTSIRATRAGDAEFMLPLFTTLPSHVTMIVKAGSYFEHMVI